MDEGTASQATSGLQSQTPTPIPLADKEDKDAKIAKLKQLLKGTTSLIAQKDKQISDLEKALQLASNTDKKAADVVIINKVDCCLQTDETASISQYESKVAEQHKLIAMLKESRDRMEKNVSTTAAERDDYKDKYDQHYSQQSKEFLQYRQKSTESLAGAVKSVTDKHTDTIKMMEMEHKMHDERNAVIVDGLIKKHNAEMAKIADEIESLKTKLAAATTTPPPPTASTSTSNVNDSRATELKRELDIQIQANQELMRMLNTRSEMRDVAMQCDDNESSDVPAWMHSLNYARLQRKLEMDNAKLSEDLSRISSELSESKADVSTLTKSLQSKDKDIIALQGRIATMQCDSNIEYLHNVVYKYITTDNGDERVQLGRVMSTILQFTSTEAKDASAAISRYNMLTSSVIATQMNAGLGSIELGMKSVFDGLGSFFTTK